MGALSGPKIYKEDCIIECLSGINVLCKSCKLKCKQFVQIDVLKCPTYLPKKKHFDIQKQSKNQRRA